MSLALDLIDRVIDLLLRRERVNRATYDDVVKSLMADVDALHRDYLESFRRYRDALAERKSIDAAFLDDLAADSLFSRDLRARVRAVAETDVQQRLRPLMRAVQSYLQLATVNPLDEWDESITYKTGHHRHRSNPLPQTVPRDDVEIRMERTLEEWGLLFILNASRLYLANGIMTVLQKGLEPELAARLAVRMIESIVSELQRRYSVIARANSDIRTALLDPK